MKAEIKKHIDQIDKKMYGFENEKRDFFQFQKQKLELYQQKDFLALENTGIIVEVREFKARIEDANNRLFELDDYLKMCGIKKDCYQKINTLNKDLDIDMTNLKDFFSTLPTEIEQMLLTLKEMKNGSEPDESADYHAKKSQIIYQTKNLEDVKKKINDIEGEYFAK